MESMKRSFKLLVMCIFVVILITSCSSKSKYEENNDSFKTFEDNISTGTAATYFTRLKKTKEISGLGNVYEMNSKKGSTSVSIVEDNDNVIEVDVNVENLEIPADWATATQIFALSLSSDLSNITEMTTHDEVIKDVSKFLSDKMNEVFKGIDFENGEKSAYKKETIGNRSIVYTVNIHGDKISFNYLVNNRGLYDN